MELISKGQCFPRYRYRSNGKRQGDLPGIGALDRVDNITDATLKTFRVHYHDPQISRNAIASRYALGKREMRYVDDDKSNLAINDVTELRGIPPDAHRYKVNGRMPLDWLMDRYHIVQDRQSGIVNDPNAWFDKPQDLLAAIERVVHASVETARIIKGLPEVG